MFSCFECARAVRSLVCVPCFVLERGVRIPALMSWVSVFVSGFGHSRSVFCHCVSARSRVRSLRALLSTCVLLLHAVRVSIGCVHSCYILCCVARSLCISLAACFHVVMSCVNTWLMSFLISCVFVSCFAHGWWFVCWPCACDFVLCEHVASVLVFCVPRALMSICLDPTHLVTCLLINVPQLLSLVTLLICSLYNLLVFAGTCGFVAICWVVYVLCPALSSLPPPPRGCFCLFYLLFINKKPVFLQQLCPRSLPITHTWQIQHILNGYIKSRSVRLNQNKI